MGMQTRKPEPCRSQRNPQPQREGPQRSRAACRDKAVRSQRGPCSGDSDSLLTFQVSGTLGSVTKAHMIPTMKQFKDTNILRKPSPQERYRSGHGFRWGHSRLGSGHPEGFLNEGCRGCSPGTTESVSSSASGMKQMNAETP